MDFFEYEPQKNRYNTATLSSCAILSSLGTLLLSKTNNVSSSQQSNGASNLSAWAAPGSFG